MQVMGSYGDHERDKDAEMYITSASPLSSSSQDDSVFQLLCLSEISELKQARQRYI